MIDRTTFFGEVRRTLFGGRLTQSQVDGINTILNEWEYQDLTDVRHLAYMLATPYQEVDKTMQPIKEYGGDKYFFRLYDMQGGRPAVARQLGNLQPGDGVRFPGRGLVQLTGRANYMIIIVIIMISTASRICLKDGDSFPCAGSDVQGTMQPTPSVDPHPS